VAGIADHYPEIYCLLLETANIWVERGKISPYPLQLSFKAGLPGWAELPGCVIFAHVIVIHRHLADDLKSQPGVYQDCVHPVGE